MQSPTPTGARRVVVTRRVRAGAVFRDLGVARLYGRVVIVPCWDEVVVGWRGAWAAGVTAAGRRAGGVLLTVVGTVLAILGVVATPVDVVVRAVPLVATARVRVGVSLVVTRVGCAGSGGGGGGGGTRPE